MWISFFSFSSSEPFALGCIDINTSYASAVCRMCVCERDRVHVCVCVCARACRKEHTCVLIVAHCVNWFNVWFYCETNVRTCQNSSESCTYCAVETQIGVPDLLYMSSNQWRLCVCVCVCVCARRRETQRLRMSVSLHYTARLSFEAAKWSITFSLKSGMFLTTVALCPLRAWLGHSDVPGPLHCTGTSWFSSALRNTTQLQPLSCSTELQSQKMSPGGCVSAGPGKVPEHHSGPWVLDSHRWETVLFALFSMGYTLTVAFRASTGNVWQRCSNIPACSSVALTR